MKKWRSSITQKKRPWHDTWGNEWWSGDAVTGLSGKTEVGGAMLDLLHSQRWYISWEICIGTVLVDSEEVKHFFFYIYKVYKHRAHRAAPIHQFMNLDRKCCSSGTSYKFVNKKFIVDRWHMLIIHMHTHYVNSSCSPNIFCMSNNLVCILLPKYLLHDIKNCCCLWNLFQTQHYKNPIFAGRWQTY
jgi:hypothetical protein